MANDPKPGNGNQSNQDALAALQGMQSGAPVDSGGSSAAENAGAPSSTGLVGMLSQGQISAPSPDLGGGSKTGYSAGVPMGVPQPKSPGSSGPAAKRPGKFDKIGMAKEITLPPPEENILGGLVATSPPAASRNLNYVSRPARRSAKPPEWWKAAIPVMYTVSSLLMMVSFWAIGAFISILLAKEGFPGVDFDPDAPTSTRLWANIMPVIMLFGLPVSITIGIMAVILGKKIRVYDQKMAAAEDAAQ